MKLGQKKEGLPCHIGSAKPPKHFHVATAPDSLSEVQHHKETPALDVFLPTATYL